MSLTDLATSIIDEKISTIEVPVTCPKCKGEFTARFGKVECPHCHYQFETQPVVHEQ